MSEVLTKTVTIPACDQHDGFSITKVKLEWICPICRKPRGEIKNVRSYDGSRYLHCDGWENPCGHIDKYSDVREEAENNGLNNNYPEPQCSDFKECEKCTECFYYKDRCTYLDSDVQLWISGNEGDM